jgi:hypothetical protein
MSFAARVLRSEAWPDIMSGSTHWVVPGEVKAARAGSGTNAVVWRACDVRSRSSSGGGRTSGARTSSSGARTSSGGGRTCVLVKIVHLGVVAVAGPITPQERELLLRATGAEGGAVPGRSRVR